MLILIEFNELSPSLLDGFMAKGLLPNFRRFYRSSTIMTTDAGEGPPNLEPWIQWPTVHSGLPFAAHRVFHLGDGRSLQHKCLAELLSDAAVRVGVMGSMNVNYGQLNGYVVPDPWDQEGRPHPVWLSPFYETVARQVQESSREGGVSKGQMARFGLFLLRNGLTLQTVRAILAQLWNERRDPGVKWRRASLLDAIQYDLFRTLNRRFTVQFATLFCNSTAHYQHYYWRNMQPEQFATPPPATDSPSLQGAIPYGYRAMDRLLGRLQDDYPHSLLVLCTALSQQPWTDTTKCTFRPHQFEDLLKFAGAPLSSLTIKPVMAEEFHIDCADSAVADATEAGLRTLSVKGQRLMKLERTGNSLFTGCCITDPSALNSTVTSGQGGTVRPFGELFYMIHTMRSGRHHPDGVLWVRNGRHAVAEEKVPLTDIAPTVLAFFGVPQPDAMHGSAIPGLLPYANVPHAEASLERMVLQGSRN